MPASFATEQTGLVPTDGRHRGSPAIRWVVQIRKAGSWISWQWFDRLRNWRRPSSAGGGARSSSMGVIGVVVCRLFA